jgi:histidinol-phosphate phosphatase family protein
MKAWGVFLDRDGTLVPDSGYMVDPGQLRLFPPVGDALASLRGEGAALVLISNQSAVARGLMDDAGLELMDRRLHELVEATGNRLDRTYYCTHHPDFGGACTCRKPSPEMILRGIDELGLDAGSSFLIGDTVTDLEAGRAAGVRTVLVLTGLGGVSRSDAEARGLADVVVSDLSAAAQWILRERI